MKDRNPESPYGVTCDECGPQGLTRQEYDRQMMRPDTFWVCPVCCGIAWWDDERYEKAEETPTMKLPLEPLYNLPMEKDELEVVMLALTVLRASMQKDVPTLVKAYQFYLQLNAQHPGVLDSVDVKVVKLGEACLEKIT